MTKDIQVGKLYLIRTIPIVPIKVAEQLVFGVMQYTVEYYRIDRPDKIIVADYYLAVNHWVEYEQLPDSSG